MSRNRTLSRLGPKTALCVIAAAPEYGPALRGRIRPLITGACPVEAAAGVAHALAIGRAEGAVPNLVSRGSAGSPTLDHARVYQVSSARYRDIVVRALAAVDQAPFEAFELLHDHFTPAAMESA